MGCPPEFRAGRGSVAAICVGIPSTTSFLRCAGIRQYDASLSTCCREMDAEIPPTMAGADRDAARAGNPAAGDTQG